MTHKVTHVKGLPDVRSGSNLHRLSENNHNRRGTEGNWSVKVAQSVLRHWSARFDANNTSTELQPSQQRRVTELEG